MLQDTVYVEFVDAIIKQIYGPLYNMIDIACM